MKTGLGRATRRYGSALALVLGVLAGCGGGGGGGGGGAAAGASPSTSAASNAAPQPLLTLSGQVSTGAGGADVATFAQTLVSLDAGQSKDPDGDPLTYQWTLVSRPAGSTLQLPDSTAAQTSFKADLPGTYVVSVRVTDSRGASAEKQASIQVQANSAPVTALTMNVTYSAAPTTLPTREVTAGAIIVLDAGASRAADGGAVATTWDLIERPEGSRASLTMGATTARLVADVAGTFKVRVRGTVSSGAYSESIYPIQALDNGPKTVLLGTVQNVTAESGVVGVLYSSLGYTVALSGEKSTDPDNDRLTYSWTLVRKPEGSKVELSSATGMYSQLVPDQMGYYALMLVTTDPTGASSSHSLNLFVQNRRPEAAIESNATPQALPTGPTVRTPVGTLLTLRGGTSIDADDDTLTYAWSLVVKPVASKAVLANAAGANAQLTTDVPGSYQVRLRVTDPSGAYSEKLLNIDSGNTMPTAVMDKSRVSVLAGNPVSASAALSFDEDNDPLTYRWNIDARPAGSSVAIAAPNTARLSFTPDLPGTYVASVTVNDGKNNSIAYVTIKALASTTNNVVLSFVPLEMRYSRGIDRFVAYATNPNALHIVDPFTGAQRQVALPLGVKSLNLSGDGKLAAVLHEGVVSLIDLDSATLIRSSSVAGNPGEAFVTDNGLIYLMGTYSGWNDQVANIIDGRTGADLTGIRTFYGQGTFYGNNQRGIFAHTKKRGFIMSSGLSPSDVSFFEIDPASGAVIRAQDSPYHGSYNMNAPFYLSGNEDLLFMPSGVYFRTDTLEFAGQLPLNNILSMSHSSSADEAIILTSTTTMEGGYSSVPTYLPSYRRYVGGLFLREADIALPLIDGQQSYGVNIFHSANDNHVTLVQTGSALRNANGIKYYLVTR